MIVKNVQSSIWKWDSARRLEERTDSSVIRIKEKDDSKNYSN